MMDDPLPTAATIRDVAHHPAGAVVDITLKAADILLEDFKYAGNTVAQAKSARGQLLSLYILMVSAIAAAFGVVNSEIFNTSAGIPTSGAAANYYKQQGIVFSIGAMLSFGFFAMLLKLGREHRAGLVAMNVIKEFYISHLKDSLPEIEQAFPWRLDNIPTPGRFGGVPQVMIAFLGSVAFSFAVYFYYLAIQIRVTFGTSTRTISDADVTSLVIHAYGIAALAGLIALFGHVLYYRAATRRAREHGVPAGKLASRM